jgi:hypothetical protein
MYFTVIIPVRNTINKPTEKNLQILSESNYVKEVYLVNFREDNIQIPNISKKIKLHSAKNRKFEVISDVLKFKVKTENVVILEQNINITAKFMNKVVSHYASRHLYTFKTNILINNNTARILDNRVGVQIKPYMFHTLAVAFNNRDAAKVNWLYEKTLEEFAGKMSNEGIALQLLNQVVVFENMEPAEAKKVSKIRQEVKRKKKPASKAIKKKPLPAIDGKQKEVADVDECLKERNMTKFSNRVDPNRKVSIIIPFMMKGDRWPLFQASIKCLYEKIKKYPNIEIIIHETSPSPQLPKWFIREYNLVYVFNEWTLPFHRSWALNIPAKHVAKGDVFCFFDADLIIDDEWVHNLLACDPKRYYIGWEVIKYLTKANTELYLKTGKINTRKIRFINQISEKRLFDIGCGGINLMPREMFFDIKGWPEHYSGLGYGAEDNSMNYKIISLGYDVGYFPNLVIHLFHDHTTSGSAQRFQIKNLHKSYTKEQWEIDLEKIKDKWGVPSK